MSLSLFYGGLIVLKRGMKDRCVAMNDAPF